MCVLLLHRSLPTPSITLTAARCTRMSRWWLGTPPHMQSIYTRYTCEIIQQHANKHQTNIRLYVCCNDHSDEHLTNLKAFSLQTILEWFHLYIMMSLLDLAFFRLHTDMHMYTNTFEEIISYFPMPSLRLPKCNLLFCTEIVYTNHRLKLELSKRRLNGRLCLCYHTDTERISLSIFTSFSYSKKCSKGDVKETDKDLVKKVIFHSWVT